MRRIIFYSIIFFLLIISNACSQQEEVKEKPATEETQEQPVTAEPEDDANANLFEYAFPLSGIGTGVESTQRPYAVIINNHPSARPQSGLHKADIIYEMLAEGDVTRFLAIFQSEHPEIIGPVRSARDYFVDFSKGFDAFFVAHGWSPDAKKILQAREVDNINGMTYDGTLFWRDNSRVAPHNSYISFENIEKGAEQTGQLFANNTPPLPFLTEQEASNLNGTNGLNVSVDYSSREIFESEYTYNTKIERYERYSYDEQTIDRETSEPIYLDNVFIVEMEHQIIDSEGRRTINALSGGKGLLLQKGVAKEVEWKNIDGRIVPYQDNKEVGLVPGKTWINIIPDSPGITGSVSFGNNN